MSYDESTKPKGRVPLTRNQRRHQERLWRRDGGKIRVQVEAERLRRSRLSWAQRVREDIFKGKRRLYEYTGGRLLHLARTGKRLWYSVDLKKATDEQGAPQAMPS